MFCCCYTFCWLLVPEENFWFFSLFVCNLQPYFFSLLKLLPVLLLLQLVLLNIIDRKPCLQGRTYFLFSSFSLFFMLYCIGWDF